MIARATPISILYDEHEAILTVLGHLDRAVGALEQGQQVPADIFEDLAQFFTLFVNACHHGKEERLLFPRLESTTVLVGEIAHLGDDHAQGTTLASRYAAAARDYTCLGLAGAGPLVAAARTYAAFLHEHIRYEDDVLYRAQAQFMGSAPAQDELVAAFELFEAEVMGRGTHERLHRMIATLGPRLERYGPAQATPARDF